MQYNVIQGIRLSITLAIIKYQNFVNADKQIIADLLPTKRLPKRHQPIIHSVKIPLTTTMTLKEKIFLESTLMNHFNYKNKDKKKKQKNCSDSMMMIKAFKCSEIKDNKI